MIGDAPVGCLKEDLAAAVAEALTLSPAACRDHALRFSWRNSAEQFLRNLVPMTGARPAMAPEPPVAAAPDGINS